MAKPWERYQAKGDAPWSRYKKADFSDVQSRVEQWEDPTGGMTNSDKVRAGAGKSLVDNSLGLWQSAVEMVAQPLGALHDIVGYPGLDAPRNYAARLRAEEDARQAQDSPLMNTKAGLAGYVAGQGAQMLAPAVAARGTGVARFVNPSSLRGNALQGGLLGAIQPVGTQDSRMTNAAIGVASAGVPALAGKVAGKVVDKARQVAPYRRAAAQILKESAENPASLNLAAPSLTAGVHRSLAEETLDPGIAALQRTINAGPESKGAWDSIRRRNNVARLQALRSIGDASDLDAAVAARDSSALPSLGEALVSPRRVNVKPVAEYLDAQIKATAKNPDQNAALKAARAMIGKGEDNMSVNDAHNLRKYVGNLIGGKVDDKKSSGLAAAAQLQRAKQLLDDDLLSVPEYAKYLENFKEGSAPVNRIQLADALVQRGSGGVMDATTGEYVLTPAQFGRLTKDLDKTAQQATGFLKARAQNILSPDEMMTVNRIGDDLSRQAFADTAGRGVGSDTYQKLSGNQSMIGRIGGRALGLIPGGGLLGDVLQAGRNARAGEVKGLLAEALNDPEIARQLLREAQGNPQAAAQLMTLMGGKAGLLGYAAFPE